MKTNIQEDICDALDGKHKVRCPKCKSTRFIKRWCEGCEIIIDKEEQSTTDDFTDVVEHEEYKCRTCGRKLNEKEMI
jgi:DNA-directed RNA polymerase subunit RPC12/RpoP